MIVRKGAQEARRSARIGARAVNPCRGEEEGGWERISSKSTEGSLSESALVALEWRVAGLHSGLSLLIPYGPPHLHG
jgi:hypothetical protein